MRRGEYVKRESHGQRNRRRARALERQAARAERTSQEQLALLDQRPGESKRERARLMREVAA